MNLERAQEIIDSPVMINVEYRGIPVYLKEIKAEQDKAIVFTLDNMDDEQAVDLYGLIETGPPGLKTGLKVSAQRAEEISESPVMQHVTYNGDAIYIQTVDADSETARVYPLDDPQNEFVVQISDLIERAPH